MHRRVLYCEEIHRRPPSVCHEHWQAQNCDWLRTGQTWHFQEISTWHCPREQSVTVYWLERRTLPTTRKRIWWARSIGHSVLFKWFLTFETTLHWNWTGALIADSIETSLCSSFRMSVKKEPFVTEIETLFLLAVTSVFLNSSNSVTVLLWNKCGISSVYLNA